MGQAIFNLFMARLVHLLLTTLVYDNHNILETDTAKRYSRSLNSILEGLGRQHFDSSCVWASQRGFVQSRRYQ